MNKEKSCYSLISPNIESQNSNCFVGIEIIKPWRGIINVPIAFGVQLTVALRAMPLVYRGMQQSRLARAFIGANKQIRV